MNKLKSIASLAAAFSLFALIKPYSASAVTLSNRLLHYRGCPATDIKEIQAVGTGAVSGTTVTTSLTPTAGNFLVAFVGFYGSSITTYNGTVVNVTDSLGNTWHPTPPSGSSPGVQIWYAMNVTGGSADTVTATQAIPAYDPPTSVDIDIAVVEYSGVATTNALDVTSQNPSGLYSGHGTPMITTAQCDLVVAGFVNGSGIPFPGPGTGYVQRFNDGGDTPFAIYEDNVGSLAQQGSNVSASAALGAGGVAQASFRSATSGNQAVAPTQAVITTAAQNLSTWQCSSAVTVQLQNASSQPVNSPGGLNVALSAGTATFYSDSGCTYPITSSPIYAGTNSTSFYVMFPDTSNGTITATPTALSALNQTETLNLAQYTWIGGASCDGNFNTGACWQGGAVPNGVTAHFDSTCTTHCDATFNGNENTSLWVHSSYNHTITQGAYNLDNSSIFEIDGGTYTITTGEWSGYYFTQKGGTFNAGAATLNLSGFANFFLGGTFNPGTSTANFQSSGTRNLYVGSGVTFNNVVTSNNENVPVYGGPITINGNLTMSSTSGLDFGGTLTLGGNLANTSTGYNFYGGTLVLTPGASHTISGTTTFYNLTMDDSAGAAADTLTFAAGSNSIVSNSLTLKGNSTNDLKLRSGTGGTQWKINPQGARSLANLDVEDSNNTNSSLINLSGTGSINSTDNTNWYFSYATPALVQSPAKLTSSCTSCTSASLSATTAGNLIVVGIVNGTTTLSTGLTDNASTANTYTKAKSKANTGACELWYSAGTRSATQVTVNYGSTQSPAIYVYEFSGIATSGAKDIAVSSSGSSTGLGAPTTLTSIANEVVLSAAYGAHALTLTGSFTGNTILGPSNDYDAAYQVESATGTYGASWTQSTGAWAECTASFEALLQ